MSDQELLAELRRANLSRWLEAHSISRTELAKRLEVGRAYVSLLFNPGRFFGEKSARKIERVLGMPDGQLDSEGGQQEATDNWIKVSDIASGMSGLVPMVMLAINQETGGISRQPRQLPPIPFGRDWLIKNQVTERGGLVMAANHGDAMEPYLREGDIILIDLLQTDIDESAVYAIKYGAEIRARRLSRRFDGGLIIRADNPRYKEELLSAADAKHIAIFGRVLWRAG